MSVGYGSAVGASSVIGSGVAVGGGVGDAASPGSADGGGEDAASRTPCAPSAASVEQPVQAAMSHKTAKRTAAVFRMVIPPSPRRLPAGAQ